MNSSALPPTVPTANPRLAALENLLAGPRDNALLRHSLGLEYLKAGLADAAEKSFRAALERDSQFTAAWKSLGRVCLEQGHGTAARAAWEQGKAVADARGDVQASRGMAVFLRRLDKPPAA